MQLYFISSEAQSHIWQCCCCLVSQSCPTICNPMDCCLPGSSVQRILQTRKLEWVAISFSKVCFWGESGKVKVQSLSGVQILTNPWTVPARLLHPWDFPGKITGMGCHFLLHWQCKNQQFCKIGEIQKQ